MNRKLPALRTQMRCEIVEALQPLARSVGMYAEAVEGCAFDIASESDLAYLFMICNGRAPAIFVSVGDSRVTKNVIGEPRQLLEEYAVNLFLFSNHSRSLDGGRVTADTLSAVTNLDPGIDAILDDTLELLTGLDVAQNRGGQYLAATDTGRQVFTDKKGTLWQQGYTLAVSRRLESCDRSGVAKQIAATYGIGDLSYPLADSLTDLLP